MLGIKLKMLREQRGLSQVTLAKRAKVTQPYITMLESGAFSNPTLDVLKKLAKELKTTVGELVK